MFQVLRPGRSKRRRLFALGAVVGGVVGVVLTYGGQMLFGQPGARIAAPPPSPDATPATAPEAARPPAAAPDPSPSLTPPLPATPQTPPSPSAPAAPAPAASPPTESTLAQAPASFAISGRGLEASVRAEIARRNLDESTWKEVYGEVISLNINMLCSPERWLAAEAVGRKPLDLINADTRLAWPTETDFVKPARLQECPVYRIPM